MLLCTFFISYLKTLLIKLQAVRASRQWGNGSVKSFIWWSELMSWQQWYTKDTLAIKCSNNRQFGDITTQHKRFYPHDLLNSRFQCTIIITDKSWALWRENTTESPMLVNTICTNRTFTHVYISAHWCICMYLFTSWKSNWDWMAALWESQTRQQLLRLTSHQRTKHLHKMKKHCQKTR